MARSNDVDPLEIRSLIHQVTSRSRRETPLPAQPSFYPTSVSVSGHSNQRSGITRDRATSRSSNGTGPSSVFDGASSVYSVSTAPPRHGADAERRPAVLPTVPQTPQLSCEFDGYSHCAARFHLSNVDGWIDHISRVHLGYRYPTRSVCWFCNTLFEAPDGDYQAAFEARLRHIADHFRIGNMGSNINPDFYVLDHLDMTNRRTFGHSHAPQGREPRFTVSAEEQWNPPAESYRRRRDGSIVYLP